MGIGGVFSSAKFSFRRLGVDENEATNSGSSRVEKLELELVSSVDEDSRSFSSSAILLIVAGDQS